MTVSQYLARLAAEATTAINAKDFGHAIYDLSVRRSLIRVGQEMIDVAYDAPVDFAPPLHLTPQRRSTDVGAPHSLLQAGSSTCMARLREQGINTATQSLRQLRRFCHLINMDKVFGTHRRQTPGCEWR